MNDTSSIPEDIAFQQKTWLAQRVTWIVMALIILAAAAGVFGGHMSATEQQDPAGRLSVTYERVQRHLAPTQMRISILADDTTQSPSVRISNALAEAVEQRVVVPAPRLSTLHGDGPVLTFDAIPGGRLDIHIVTVPSSYGRLKGEIALVGADGSPQATVPISAFVLP